MNNSTRHFAATAFLALIAVCVWPTFDTETTGLRNSGAAAFLFDYALAFLLIGGVHKALEDRK